MILEIFTHFETLCSKLLWEEYMVIASKHTPREKNDWMTAAYQTAGSGILCYVSLKRQTIPSIALSNVTALIIKRLTMTMYGKRVRKQTALPVVLLTPLQIITQTNIQLTSNARINFYEGNPSPSSILISLRTYFLIYRQLDIQIYRFLIYKQCLIYLRN